MSDTRALLINTLRCPISGIIMGDPVILSSSGVSYERSVLESWMRLHGTDPSSGEPLPKSTRVMENVCLRQLIWAILDNVGN
jgi:hypothetical protein